MKLEYKRISEANIQAEFYRQCMDHGLHCYLEFPQGNCRFDAVVYTKPDKDIHFIIEIKSYKSKTHEAHLYTEQTNKYRQFGIPVLVIVRRSEILKTVRFIKKKLEEKGYKYFPKVEPLYNYLNPPKRKELDPTLFIDLVKEPKKPIKRRPVYSQQHLSTISEQGR
jgi:hypothetical protein